jgi:hypothetical protein
MCIKQSFSFRFYNRQYENVAGFTHSKAYGLDGSGIEFRWGRVFQPLSRPALRTTQPPVKWAP